MKVTNVRVYGFEESIVASGFPKISKVNPEDFDISVYDLKTYPENNRHMNRIKRLSTSPAGSGHATALSGIIVQANVTGSNVFWLEHERYHFQQIVSSMSKQHMLRKMMQEGTITFNSKTDQSVIDAFMLLLSDDDVDDETLVLSTPMGMELTARVTYNYLQLRSMYSQRKNHKLTDWREFCKWIETLPMAKELITGE